MQPHHFLLKITGEMAAGCNREQCIADFARLFSLTHDKAKSLLAQGPQVVREGLDAVLAERYQAALRHIGIRSIIERRSDLSGSVVILPDAS